MACLAYYKGLPQLSPYPILRSVTSSPGMTVLTALPPYAHVPWPQGQYCALIVSDLEYKGGKRCRQVAMSSIICNAVRKRCCPSETNVLRETRGILRESPMSETRRNEEY